MHEKNIQFFDYYTTIASQARYRVMKIEEINEKIIKTLPRKKMLKTLPILLAQVKRLVMPLEI